MINNLIEKYKEKIEYYSKLDSVNCNIRAGLYTQILQDLEELKVEIDKLAKDKNFFENYYYDDMFAKGKISKELYAKFKGLGVDIDE